MEPNHNNLDKWCKGKPLLLAGLARNLTLQAEELAEFLGKLRNGEKVSALEKVPSGTEWAKLYQQHRRVQGVMLRSGMLPLDESDATGLEEMQQAMLGVARKDPEELKKEISAGVAEMGPEGVQALLRDSVEFAKEFAELGMGESEDEESPEEIEATLSMPEVVFFMRVYLPCLLEYGEYPARLMRKARQGDLESMEKLLRLDKGALLDKKISAHWQRESLHREGLGYLMLCQALQGAPHRRDVRGVKVGLASLLSKVSETMAEASAGLPEPLRTRKLTAPEIRGLFDAVAKDAGKGLIDTDLPDGDEALGKSIQRGRALWKFLPKAPGQK